jgi:AraC-like DNA-binding protein
MERAVTDPAPLRAALESLRLDGAIFFRAELTESWSYESPPAELAGLLRPGADRLIMFHIVAAGRCWVAVGDGERHWAKRGDVIVLPYGDLHRVGGLDEAESVPIVSLIAPPPWESMPVLQYGGGGQRTDIVCGYLHSEDPLFDPRMQAFPPAFVVTPPPGPAAEFVQSSITWALATTQEYRPAMPVSTRLPELLLVEVLRLHLASAPASDHGWIAALHDPVLAPALAELHAAPAKRWTVADLAARANVSRSLLDQRFRDVLGLSPIRYLTEWRMHLAEELLATTELTVFEIARRVGYESEEAFSRAFRRAAGEPPSAWRAERRPGRRPAEMTVPPARGR